MKLSITERWMLANQYRILERLYPDEAGSLNQDRTALEDGYELHYEEAASRVNISMDGMTEDECREVLDILNMYRALTFSYRDLPEKTGIEERDIEFPGFDGNNEGKQLAYAKYFCALDEGRFTELGTPENSHFPTMNRYRRMLEDWESSENKYKLTREDIQRILSPKREA